MNRTIVKLALAAASSLFVMGCTPDTYQPKAEPTQLSAYAGKSEYPDKIHSEEATHIFSKVDPNATITLYNAGDEPVVDFELWVNRAFTLHVDKLDARSQISIDPKTLYNHTGDSMAGKEANKIAIVQIQTGDKLLDVQGPILPH